MGTKLRSTDFKKNLQDQHQSLSSIYERDKIRTRYAGCYYERDIEKRITPSFISRLYFTRSKLVKRFWI